MRKLKWALPGIRYVVCDSGDVPISVHARYVVADHARAGRRHWTIHKCNAMILIDRDEAVEPEKDESSYWQIGEVHKLGNKKVN